MAQLIGGPLLIGGLGVPELLIILAVVLLLFGGTKLAGLGKSTGRALREFKEETKGLTEKEQADADDQKVVDAELVDDPGTESPRPATEQVSHNEPRRDS